MKRTYRGWSMGGTLLLMAIAGTTLIAPGAGAPQEPAWRGSIRIPFASLAKRAKISQAEAEKAALASVAGGAADKKVTGSELATENDSLAYEVSVAVNGQTKEVLVDAGNGKVLGDREAGSIRLDLAKQAKISRADAEKTALAAIEGNAADKTAGENELEVENDSLVYQVDVHVSGQPGMWEVVVDAGDGKVLAREHEGAEK
jgi:uncharacterized membrane protein YkoI